MQGTELELRGRTALVTGAGRGLGRAVARSLAQAGAELILVGRHAGRLDAVARELGGAEVLVQDLRQPGLAAERAGEVDVLVHGAAHFVPYTQIHEVSDEDYRDALETNFSAVVRLDGAALTGMRERGFGRLVYLGSRAGTRGAKRQAVYAATKAALVGWMRSVALEGARDGVTANLLELGLFDTERVAEAVGDDVRQRIIEATPVGRLGRPEEAAEAVRFLASPRASYITGAVLPVAGGLGRGLYPEQLK